MAGAEVLACSPRPGHAEPGALADDLALERCHRREHVEDEPAHGVAAIQLLSDVEQVVP